MHIEILSGNSIINPVLENDRFCISNFLLRKVHFVNNSEDQIELYELAFEVFAINKPVRKIVYSGEAFKSRVTNSKERCFLLPEEEIIIYKEHFSIVSESAV